MKVQSSNWCKGTQRLVPVIAAGRLRSDQTQPFIYGTYLEAWWRCLKLSKEFTQSCRTGIFTSRAAYETYCKFGSLEDMSFDVWWLSKGHEYFSQSITTLQVSLFVKHQKTNTLAITVDAFENVPSQLAGREFEFWIDQIHLLNAQQGMLSAAPLSWPIFKSRITYDAICQILKIMEAHDRIIQNAPKTKLWQIGEQLNIKPAAMSRKGDYKSSLADKHKAMGQIVSNYLRKGRGLVDNACNGVFPKFTAK